METWPDRAGYPRHLGWEQICVHHQEILRVSQRVYWVKMKITVIGTGYVGLVTGTCFSDFGHNVWCVDVEMEKIAKLNQGKIPIYEPDLEEMVCKNYKEGRLHFTTNSKEAIEEADLVFIAVGTPPKEDGSADLDFVFHAAADIGSCMCRPLLLVDKSTVPVGTAGKVKQIIRDKLVERGLDLPFTVLSNPEFLKEGSAVADCMKPDRIIIGTDSQEAGMLMRSLYLPFVKQEEDLIFMDVASAEMTKYAANAMLASRISFMNEISNICERVGADINEVKRGLQSDTRIGAHFLNAGCGYGGSCFPKDVKALIHIGRYAGYEPALLKAVERVNEAQKKVLVKKVTEHFGEDLSGLIFAVWGLAFKPDTDDMREAPAITVIGELTIRGARVNAYDPQAVREAKERYLSDNPRVCYTEDNKYNALDEADALILLTEWTEFCHPDMEEIKKRLHGAVVFDGRNQYDKYEMKRQGFTYYQIGVETV